MNLFPAAALSANCLPWIGRLEVAVAAATAIDIVVMVVVVIVLYILGTLPPQEHSPEIFAAAKATVPIVPALASETLSSSSFSYLTEITFGCGNIYYGMAM